MCLKKVSHHVSISLGAMLVTCCVKAFWYNILKLNYANTKGLEFIECVGVKCHVLFKESLLHR